MCLTAYGSYVATYSRVFQLELLFSLSAPFKLICLLVARHCIVALLHCCIVALLHCITTS
jgi:hypothetical protein